MTFLLSQFWSSLHRRLLEFSILATVATLACSAQGAEAKVRFDLPEGTAERTLKNFALQSDLEVLFSTDAAAGVTTRPVKGEFTPREALDRLLKDTVLLAVQDEKTGTVRVQRIDRQGKPSSAPSQPADGSSSGVIAGRVVSAATGTYLRNARVLVEGTALEVLSDESGRFIFPHVPAGEQRLRASYTGLAPIAIAVRVPATEPIMIELRELEPKGTDQAVRLDAYRVITAREMSAAEMAINEKRIASNIKEVIATDAFGTLAQDNIGDFLQYLPGVEVEGDGSAPLTVGLRGMPPEYTNISIDGAGISVPQTGGSTRVTALRGLTMSNIDRIEINKGPSPDIGADSIGGSINMIPRSAFERSRPELRYRTFLLLNSEFLSLAKTPGGREGGDGRSYKWFPDFELSYINPVNQRFGFAVNASRNDYFNSARVLQRGYSIVNSDPSRPYLTTLTGQANHHFSRRSSLGVKADFRVGERGTLSVSYNFNRYWVDFGNHQMSYATGTLLAPAADGTRNATTGDFGPAFTQGRPGLGSVTQLVTQSAYQTTQTHQGQVTYRHRGSLWDVDLTVAKSKTKLTYRIDSYGQIGQARLGLTGLTLSLMDIDPENLVPSSIVARNAGGSILDTGLVSNFGVYSTPAYTIRDIKNNFSNAKVDITRKLQPGDFSLALKSGAFFRQAAKDRAQPQITRTYSGPAFNSLPSGTLIDPTFNLEGPRGLLKGQQWLSVKNAYDLYQANPAYYTTSPGNDYAAWAGSLEESAESIYAGYAMADAAFFRKRFRLSGGVRYERTEVTARGSLTNLSLQYQRDANGRIVDGNSSQPGVQPIPLSTDPLEIARLTRLPLANRVEQSYDDFFPSVNATWSLLENLLLRAGYAHTIGRPTLAQLIPTTGITQVTAPAEDVSGAGLGTITSSNPALTPWTGRNYDLALEYYTRAGGLFSVSGYRRDVRNFIENVETLATPARLEELGLSDEYVNYLLIHPENVAGSVRQTGLELSVRQRLRTNLSVFANHTRSRTEGTRSSGFSNAQTRRTNAGVQFAFRSFATSLNYNWVGRRRGGASAIAPGAFVYTAPRQTVTLNVEYLVRSNLSAYVTLNNLFNEPVTLETYGPATPAYARVTQETKVGTQIQLGLKGSF